VKILLTGNINSLPFKQQVAATTAAFAALPFVDRIETVYYLSVMIAVAKGHLHNTYKVMPFEPTVSLLQDVDAVVGIAYGGYISLFWKSFNKAGKPVYLIDADNPTVIANGWNISSAEVCRIRGWNVGDVVSDGIALRSITRINEHTVYGRICNDNQFDFGEEVELLLGLTYKKEDIR